MVGILGSVTWDVSDKIIDIGPLALRWYGLFFAIAFVIGYRIIQYVYKKEGIPLAECDSIAMYMVIGVVVGARLGHVLFYQPDYYFAHPGEILQIWQGGLASHGAAIGILISIWLYSRKPIIPSYLWMLDRIILTVPLGGAMIRLGNLMNSEIYGHPTDLPWGFIFVRSPESGNIPRHPTQIYEAIGYIVTYLILIRYYNKHGRGMRQGSLFGIFLILLFGSRFIWEFFKENQVAFENNLPLNLGQLLSIPFVLAGIGLYIYSQRKRPDTDANASAPLVER